MWRNFFRFILFLFLLFLISKTSVYAADFSFDYVVTYDVKPNGTTQVTHNITLTNNVTSLYAQNYTLTIASEKIDQITASDKNGKIIPKAEKSDGQTTITVPFTEKVVGKDATNTFSLNYESRDIAHQNGRIWEIIIPGQQKLEGINSYTIRLRVPSSFGTAAYLYPAPKEELTWTIAEHKGKGITAAFGQYQHFTFNLRYQLENTTHAPKKEVITIPPNTAFQKVSIEHISTVPENVEIDADGNWLATYQLKADEKKEIMVEGSVFIYSTPQKEGQVVLTPELKKMYTQPQKYWEQTPAIIDKAKQLQTAEAIYNYVVDTLTYDTTRVAPGIDRLGAAYTWDHPEHAVCMEFSDLFVALARAVGIPAREIHGYAYTTNPRLQPISLVSDVLHAWPEYYDENRKIWVPIDPTWGNTTRGIDYFSKLDFNHIAFAILGQQSDYPYPAGAFRTNDSDKNVFVDFSKDAIAEIKPQFTVNFEKSIMLWPFLEKETDVTITNNGSTVLDISKLLINSSVTNHWNQPVIQMIPPYGRVTIPIKLRSKNEIQKSMLEVKLDEQVFTKPINVIPLPRVMVFLVGGLLLTGVSLYGIVKIYGITRRHS